MIDIKKTNIIVTGASGGIGGSIIEKLYGAGANILAKEQMLKKTRSFLLNFSDK